MVDRALDAIVRAYQRDRRLKVDGWLAPGGETERSLHLDLAAVGAWRDGRRERHR